MTLPLFLLLLLLLAVSVVSADEGEIHSSINVDGFSFAPSLLAQRVRHPVIFVASTLSDHRLRRIVNSYIYVLLGFFFFKLSIFNF